MDAHTSEIAEGIHRFSTFVPGIGPTGLTVNQYLIDDEQPLLFHTGHRATFPAPRRGHRRDHPA
jgi:flavorubredoxin